MAFRTLSALLISTCFSLQALAEELQLNPNHPSQYTVVSGDTLWEIAGKFLQHPWQWPDLWSQNTQIQNPHLIYPGDTIYFSMVNGKPQLSLSRSFDAPTGELAINGPCVLKEEEWKKGGRSRFPVSPDGKLQPCIRESNIDQAIRLIPMDRIIHFLSSPRVVGANELTNAPYVLDLAGEHVVGATGSKIYVRNLLNANKQQSLVVYRAGDTYKSSENGQVLGYEAQRIADAVLERPGDPATLVVTKIRSEIRMGDRVMLAPEEDINLNYFPRPPEKKITASIISVQEGVTQIGLYNSVVIDKGSQDGLKVGHELAIFKKGRVVLDKYTTSKNHTVTLPDEEAGTLMVFRTFDRVSFALVMKATQDIHVLDKVRTP